jgi:hypothetical protein
VSCRAARANPRAGPARLCLDAPRGPTMPKYAALLLLVILSATLHARDDDPEPRARVVKPREIVVEGLPARRGDVNTPISIPSEKRLAELVPSEDVRAAILKQVDFRKEKPLLFRWHGRPADAVVPVAGKPGEAAFEYAPGGDDLGVLHAKLFAVPARATVRVTAKAAR